MEYNSFSVRLSFGEINNYHIVSHIDFNIYLMDSFSYLSV